MSKEIDSEIIYKQIKLLSNKKKFQIILLTQTERRNIKDLSKRLKLAYNKVSDYVAELEKGKLVSKVKEGKEVYVKSAIKISDDGVNIRPR